MILGTPFYRAGFGKGGTGFQPVTCDSHSQDGCATLVDGTRRSQRPVPQRPRNPLPLTSVFSHGRHLCGTFSHERHIRRQTAFFAVQLFQYPH
jgi:hypothetical protein